MAAIRKLLIANRGEIACRIISACRAVNIATVAVYSEADRKSPHVSAADQAVCIGPPAAAESYLNIDRLIEACATTGADALHPGYGFLSERAELAEACTAAGVLFVGPPAHVIRDLGDKSAARLRMERAGVPVVPGYAGDDQTSERFAAEAARIGVPLLVKAAAGGGGRGMREVHALPELQSAIDEARREAESAFGDGRLLLERLILKPRHVEVQIFGDTHGTVVSLFERECSIQRRHQKVIEESPCRALDDELRAALCAAAVTAGREAGYVNAGTVEFLVEEQEGRPAAFYFLEVNTRLQVEHAVTEWVAGMDLVALQLIVAAGHPLPEQALNAECRGHAIEARVYAEDPRTGFLPSVGRIERLTLPQGPGVRVDSGVLQGTEVSPWYDPMLAKITAFGESREAARCRLICALEDTAILGVTTNISFLLAVLRDEQFVAGATHTGFLVDRNDELSLDNVTVPDDVLLLLAAYVTGQPRPGRRGEATGTQPNVWAGGTGWRNV